MALPRAGHWGANCHLEGQKSNHSFFITYCFPTLPLHVFTLFLPPVVGSPDILWLLWFNCTLKLSAGISSCSFRKINSVSRDQIPWRSKSWTCSGALINFKLVWACSVLDTQEKVAVWLWLGIRHFDFTLQYLYVLQYNIDRRWSRTRHTFIHQLWLFLISINAVFLFKNLGMLKQALHIIKKNCLAQF